jgi:hypothetical protein
LVNELKHAVTFRDCQRKIPKPAAHLIVRSSPEIGGAVSRPSFRGYNHEE